MKKLPATPTEIRELIPQRHPFVLVDSILEYDEKMVVAGFTIPSKHVLVKSDGELTEAGLIEHFAQSIALHQGYEYFLKDLPAPVGYIGSIKNIEIFSLPVANQQLVTKIEILSQMLGVTLVKGEVSVNGAVIARGEMRTVIVEQLKESGLQRSK
jgi:3-hydroxyacyl-[acyl-carrier-protein] dehydratase